ncbi:hypothetical protein, partial [Paeniglutamicibacter sulfureus]|uniref:hypothetical protein n=1 Tax=Paeniglutamicibacter sulfureus TaxID=43666 RepID=UPI0035EC26CB
QGARLIVDGASPLWRRRQPATSPFPKTLHSICRKPQTRHGSAIRWKQREPAWTRIAGRAGIIRKLHVFA